MNKVFRNVNKKIHIDFTSKDLSKSVDECHE